VPERARVLLSERSPLQLCRNKVPCVIPYTNVFDATQTKYLLPAAKLRKINHFGSGHLRAICMGAA
jgi:hypothetical protein